MLHLGCFKLKMKKLFGFLLHEMSYKRLFDDSYQNYGIAIPQSSKILHNRRFKKFRTVQSISLGRSIMIGAWN